MLLVAVMGVLARQCKHLFWLLLFVDYWFSGLGSPR